MKRAALGFAFLSVVLFPPCASAAIFNALKNPGFETAIGSSPGNWDNTANRGLSVVTGGTPGEGASFLRLDEATTVAGGFVGVFTFQVVEGAKAGDFVSFSGLVRANALNAGDEGQLRIEFKNAAGVDIGGAVNVAVSAVSGSFARVVVSSVAPVNTAQVAFVIRIQPSNAGGGSQVDFDATEGTITSSPLILEATPSSTSATAGQMKLIALRVLNASTSTLTGVEVTAEPQAGLNIPDERITFNGSRVGTRPGSVIFSLGNLSPGQESVFSFPLILTSAVLPGRSYELTLFGRASAGAPSPVIRVLIRAELDPVFDEGTIIGKVFNDLNQNGAQDPGEKGVPWVRLATEEGIVIVTDENGKYHIPAVKPGRHIVKIDGHTLPEGTKFISEESLLVKTTSGLMSKANFAVLVPPSKLPDQFQKDLMVSITQGLDTSRPNLGVTIDPDILKVGVDILEREARFRFEINYPEFVSKWYLEIRDEMGREVWTGFGVGAPPAEVFWPGQTEAGTVIKPGIYSYQLKVEDKDGRQDWTPLSFFRVVSKRDSEEEQNRPVEIPPVGDFNIFRDGRRSIPLVAKPTLRIQGRTRPENQLAINGQPVSVDATTGAFQAEVYTSPGEKEIIVSATNPEGESTSYREKVKVKDSTFFMVALAEEQFGTNFQDGNVEAIAQEDVFKRGFYEDGRVSYYLRGKLKGKFLVKSHYDTSDERSALFTNLDPDSYYPVYGDQSTRDYEAQDGLERFYFVVEMDRSFAKWGSYKTEFNDTELATYNRTLSGLKVHHETLSSTVYGDPKKGFKLFWSEARHKADHNEFAATGGSLYYLRNRGVIQGSEKIRVEVRDKIQDMMISSYNLTEGLDYEIDYASGRILLAKPLSSVAASDTLISSDILNGSPVYLIVDYEYDAGVNAFEDSNRGLRGYTHMGDHLRVGATVIEEKRQGGDYDLRAVDATMKLGRNTKVTAEFAESKLKQVEQAVSYNGGLSFANLELLRGDNTRPRENAYLIKAESKPAKKVDVSGYLQGVEPNFSTERIRSQEGTKKYGVAARYKFTDHFYSRYRFDSAEVVGQLLPLAEHGIFAPYETLQTHTVQTVYDRDRWLAEAEYRHQVDDSPVSNLSPTLLSEIPFENGIGTKLGYRINDRLLPYLKAQTGFHEKQNHQLGGGVRYQVTRNFFAYMEQMFGNIGDSTLFGIERYRERMRSYANMKVLDLGIGRNVLATSIGNSYALSEQSRVFSEREYSNYQGVDGYAEILGYEKQINERWSFESKFERRHLDNSATRLLDQQADLSLLRTNTFNTVSAGLSYSDKKRLKARTYLEARRDQDSPRMLQVLTRNSLEYKVNQDLTFLGKLDYGKSRFLEPEDTPGHYMEMSTGFAYRPVDFDKLNFLTRYTYLRDSGSDFQFTSALFSGVETEESAHIMAIDLAYDLYRYLGVVEKLAYKNSILNTSLTNEIILHHFLWAHRFNFHVTRKWDVGLEYRALWQFDAARTLRHGALTEIDREIYDYVRFGVGYNFTDFDDDLRNTNDYDTHGPFVRLTGKF